MHPIPVAVSLSHETQHQNKRIQLELGRPNSTFAVRVTLDLSGVAGDDVDGLGVCRGAVVLGRCLVNDGGGRKLRCGGAGICGVVVAVSGTAAVASGVGVFALV